MPKLTDDLREDIVNGMPPSCDDVMDTDMDRQDMPAVLATIDVPKGKQGVQPCAAISERASRTVVDEDIARQAASDVMGVKGGADRLPLGTAGSTMLDHVQDEVEAQQAAKLRELWRRFANGGATLKMAHTALQRGGNLEHGAELLP